MSTTTTTRSGRRMKLFALATTLAVGAGGYFAYSLFAVQGAGTLAQAPLNVQTQIPPAFLMAVDDSGSMTFEGLYPQDEQAYWGTTNNCLDGNLSTCPNGFFSGPGVLRTAGRGGYYHVIPNGIRLDANRLAIPPLDLFGFARSPAFNRQYFDPTVTYQPWKFADGTPWPNAPITAARSDPRANGSAGVRGPNPVITYDFTTVEDRTNNDLFAFRFQPGMRLPAGTQYYVRSARHNNGCGGLGTTNATRDSWETVGATGHLVTTTNNLTTGNGGGCEYIIRHFQAVVFLPVGAAPPPGFNVANAVVVPNAGGAGVPLIKYELRPGNFTSGYAEAIQNYANWYTYYGNRTRAMVSAMTESLLSVNNMNIGYFTINKRSGNNPGMTGGNVIMRDVNAGGKVNLYNDLFTLPADGGTPSRSATVFMGDQFRRTDANAPIQRACQVNAGMLFTDGYTNEGGANGNVYRNFGDTDNSGGEPRPIAGNANGNTIADIAYWFYRNNLRPDLPAGLVRPRDGCSSLPVSLQLDCQTNLHMNFYGITLGTTGEIYGVNAAATADPYTNLPNWSVTGTQNLSPKNVDDIWHAAINTRGEYVSAETPADITAAMRRVIAAVNAGNSPAGSIGLTGARIGSGSLTVSPFYEARNEGTDWYSTLTAASVTSNPTTGVVSFTDVWEASTRLPAAAARNGVWFGKGNAAPEPFTAANLGGLGDLCNNPRPGMSLCSGPSLAALGGGTPITLNQAVNYLKGDQSLEVERSAAGKLRFRTTRLGDIVNSSPVISSPRDDYGYGSLPAPYGTSYATYVSTGKAGRRPMVYAGANDGMLHAFDGRADASGGVERFAFIPQSVLGFTGNLLFPFVASDGGDQKFQHRYYVDGPVVVSDAYYGGSWKTTLVGTTGAGARGAFALNVSGASQTTGSFAAGDKLWEISDLNTALSSAVRDNIGHVLGKPVIVPVKTGSGSGPVKWRAIFGNGYNSVSGKAVLFMVDIGTGAPVITMVEAVESAAPAGSNGLGNIVVVDRWGPAADDSLTSRARDGFADTVYAADQKGAIWRFDLRTVAPANLTAPVFTTLQYTSGPASGTRQPILGGMTAAAGPAGGVMLYFGTGSFSFNGDAIDSTLQSLYAVVDNGAPGVLDRTNLLQQTIGTTVGGFRTTSSNIMQVGKLGWYLDLPVNERFVGNPRIESGVVFMPTYAANATVECGADGSNWLYGLNALSGGAALTNVRVGSPTGTSPGTGTGAVGLATGGTAPVKDVAVMASPRLAPLGAGASAADLDAALLAQCSMVIQVAGAPPLYMPRACGRQSWRQVR